jgi:hypothetical protein
MHAGSTANRGMPDSLDSTAAMPAAGRRRRLMLW